MPNRCARLTVAKRAPWDTAAARCAGLILGFSRYAFIQYYPRFTRFEAQVFHNAAFAFLGGACARCTIDNTSVLVAAGSGPGALIAAPNAHFGQRFGVQFVPHTIRNPGVIAHRVVDTEGYVRLLGKAVEVYQGGAGTPAAQGTASPPAWNSATPTRVP
jgi:hypothetical protein